MRGNPRGRSVRACWAVAVVVFVTASCATSPRAPSNAEFPLPTTSRDIVLQEGDVVDIRFLYWPELNDKQSVRSDGKVTLQLVGEVQAAGLRPEELRQELLRLYTGTLKQPEITVVARVEENRRVYVGGEVNAFRNTNGLVEIPLVGRMTAIEAILLSGGFKEESARIAKVLIIRRIDDKQYIRTVDLRPLFKEAEVEPFYLEPSDIIFVPRTKIDRVDQWAEQYLDQPVPSWLRANLDLNDIIHNNTAPTPHGSISVGTGGISIEEPR